MLESGALGVILCLVTRVTSTLTKAGDPNYSY